MRLELDLFPGWAERRNPQAMLAAILPFLFAQGGRR
jgi:hypothetical protein